MIRPQSGVHSVIEPHGCRPALPVRDIASAQLRPFRQTVRSWSTVMLTAFLGYSAVKPPGTQVAPNDNRVAGGLLRDGSLEIHLVAREGVWRPDGPAGPGMHRKKGR